MKIEILPLSKTAYPWELLLLADPSRSKIESYLNHSVVLGLRIGGETVGVVVFMPTKDTVFEIMNVAVAPDHQGKGFAKKLLQEALS